MPTITVRLKEATHEMYMELCKKNNIKASSFARSMIEDMVRNRFKNAPINPVEEIEDENKHRVYSWLYESEITAIKIRCNQYKGTQQGWIAAAVRSVLNKAPTFNEPKLQALESSNYQMSSANKTLQLLLKRINSKQVEGSIVQAKELKEAIDTLSEFAKKNAEYTRKLAWDSGERWYEE